jgi:hypothetical protein
MRSDDLLDIAVAAAADFPRCFGAVGAVVRDRALGIPVPCVRFDVALAAVRNAVDERADWIRPDDPEIVVLLAPEFPDPDLNVRAEWEEDAVGEEFDLACVDRLQVRMALPFGRTRTGRTNSPWLRRRLSAGMRAYWLRKRSQNAGG